VSGKLVLDEVVNQPLGLTPSDAAASVPGEAHDSGVCPKAAFAPFQSAGSARTGNTHLTVRAQLVHLQAREHESLADPHPCIIHVEVANADHGVHQRLKHVLEDHV
jgi:hypothetical protein